MASTPRKNDILANPFHLILLTASALFALTVLAYLVGGFVLDPSRPPEAEGSRRFALWIDRNGPMLLGVEFLVMLVACVAMMATDHWFNPPRARDQKQRSQPSILLPPGRR